MLKSTLNMITINVLRIDDIEKYQNQNSLNLSEEELNKAKSYIHKEDQLRSIGGTLLINAFTSPGQILHTKEGKPCKQSGLKFNISHSGDYVIISLAKQEVGVDIQKIINANEKIINHCLTNSEKERLNKNEDFTRFWVLKESFVKCLGTGFSIRPNKIESAKENNVPYKFENEDYISFVTKFHDDYYIGLTYKRNSVEEIQINEVKVEEIVGKLK